jgi:hypothetical protein
MWLKEAAPELLEGLQKFERGSVPDHERLRSALVASGEAVTSLLRQTFEKDGRVRGFKPHATTFLG